MTENGEGMRVLEVLMSILTDWVFYSLYMYIIMLTALDFDYHHMAS